MKLFDLLKPKQQRGVVFTQGNFGEVINGYRLLNETPEIVSARFRIAQLIASETIYLMMNTSKGDVRINNELSRKIDIEPNKTMTRFTWMTGIVMDMLRNGNAIVYPHFVKKDGRYLLGDLEPIYSGRVAYEYSANSPNYYKVVIDGVSYEPNNLLHFVYNPDTQYRWKGAGLTVPLQDLADILNQAQATTKGFMRSKWKPSVIVKVDANGTAFATKEGRKKIVSDYLDTDSAGEPWIVPDMLGIDQVKPLSLADLAINDSITLNKKAVASLMGVPAFVLGAGEYNSEEWDSFINNTIRPIAQSIEQELTRKLITSPKMYLKFNVNKLYSYDLVKLKEVYGTLYDKGIVTGNEVRDKIGLEPIEDLDKLIVLENYIPISQVDKQKKVNGNGN